MPGAKLNHETDLGAYPCAMPSLKPTCKILCMTSGHTSRHAGSVLAPPASLTRSGSEHVQTERAFVRTGLGLMSTEWPLLATSRVCWADEIGKHLVLACAHTGLVPMEFWSVQQDQPLDCHPAEGKVWKGEVQRLKRTFPSAKPSDSGE
jgi:hypothetical protein